MSRKLPRVSGPSPWQSADLGTNFIRDSIELPHMPCGLQHGLHILRPLQGRCRKEASQALPTASALMIWLASLLSVHLL